MNQKLSKRTQTCLQIGLVIFSPLFLLLLIEGFSYLWEQKLSDGQLAWELVASRRIKMDYFTYPGAGYSLMKPDQHYEYRNIPVDINEQGLRSPQVEYEKNDGVYRVLNLGDSVAMGWGVRQEETYGQILAGLLASKFNRKVEVINGAVPGWNLENELAFREAEGLRYDPDLILLDLTLANDQFGESALMWDRQPSLLKWLRDNTHFWPFMMIQMKWAAAKLKGESRIDLTNPPNQPGKYFPEDANHPRWEHLTDQIRQIGEITKEREIPLIVVIFPIEFQVFDDSFSTLPQTIYSNWTNNSGSLTVDLLPAYRQACEAKPGGECILEDRYLFADVWMHPSAFGHRIAAEEINKAISKSE
jgi:hypothetical protein